MSGVYAEYTPREGYLSDSFIAELACKKLNLTPEQLEAKVGRYSKGKRAGQLRGKLTWYKITRGGWYRLEREYMHGYVVAPGTTFNYDLVDAWTGVSLTGKDPQYVTPPQAAGAAH